MNLSESVNDLAKRFIEDSEFVDLDDQQIEYLAEEMKETGAPKFPIPEVKDFFKGAVLELVAASVNYCYWYGKSSIRPLDSNSTKMYDLLLRAFKDFHPGNFKDCIVTFQVLLSQNRFPLLEERIKHLDELIKFNGPDYIAGFINETETANVQEQMIKLISIFPGFASDLFLKRASLFFIQLHRRFGWFDLTGLHVPADYQVPKMLNHYKCISYDYSLISAIETCNLIPKGSLPECEIRAATILAVKKLCELTGWNVAEVDGYLFLKRHDCSDPFHLTITTDY